VRTATVRRKNELLQNALDEVSAVFLPTTQLLPIGLPLSALLGFRLLNLQTMRSIIKSYHIIKFSQEVLGQISQRLFIVKF
jgi:hypothetical protein